MTRVGFRAKTAPGFCLISALFDLTIEFLVIILAEVPGNLVHSIFIRDFVVFEATLN